MTKILRLVLNHVANRSRLDSAMSVSESIITICVSSDNLDNGMKMQFFNVVGDTAAAH